VSITIRAVGQASRRGARRRVPNAVDLLAAVDEWLVGTETDTLRGHRAGDRTADGAVEASFHPAARPIRFEATDSGQLTVRAMTIPVGPGYHTYVVGMLRRLGDEVDITWAGATPAKEEDASAVSSDPTGAFFSGNRADAERGHLSWLRSSLTAVRDARRQHAEGLHLATPLGVRYTFDGAVATVLGPRDDSWLERALTDPRVAADVWPWVADAMDARYHLSRVLTSLWNEVRWRPPVGEAEVALLDELLATLRHAYPLEPGLPWPWEAWREVFVLRGPNDPATFQLLQRATAAAAGAAADLSATPIGYRRRPVTIVHEGWALELPGSFTDERTAEEWHGIDAGRSVTLAATATSRGGQPMSAETFLREFAAGLGTDVITHEDGSLVGRARLSSDASTGVEVATVEGYSAVRGSGAVIRIVIEDPSDWKWALDTWRSLRPA
jgi:hypothetical protein